MVYIYEPESLYGYLTEKKILSALSQYGYQCDVKHGGNMQEYLDGLCEQLSEKMWAYHSARGDFPHEIGIFLEYPLYDVEQFIKNKGQNYLLSGYWKVYRDAERARAIFKRYDMAREKAVDEVLQGRRIDEIVA